MKLANRFLSYTKFNTTTDEEAGAKGIMPSNPAELELSNFIKDEFINMGIDDVKVLDNSILIAKIPSNSDKKLPNIAFFAHLDTADEERGDTKASLISYSGGDIKLNDNVSISADELKNYVGDEIFITDGTSLLGGDDKAGIASIVTAFERIINSDIKHGDLYAIFVPDEEQGLCGSKAFDVKSISADFGYCVDGAEIGELTFKNWNAGEAVIEFFGKTAHPIHAKGVLKNSLLLANKFINLLPAGETPEYTEGEEGYFWVVDLKGNTAKTTLTLHIREFDEKKYDDRVKFIQNLEKSFKDLFGQDCIKMVIKDSYKNVYNYLKDASLPLDLAMRAYKNLGITPITTPLRGGYDGSVLSMKGLPTLNIFTGGHNLHSNKEFLPLNSLKKSCEAVVEIIKESAK